MAALPSQRELLSGIIHQLATAVPHLEEEVSSLLPGDIGAGAEILESLDEKHRQLLVSLHCILPSTLLPALDLLDRGLVVRYRVKEEVHAGGTGEVDTGIRGTKSSRPQECTTVYYVSSIAAIGRGKARKYDTSDNNGTNLTASKYEVRLNAWNCTCAGFIFSAMHPPPPSSTDVFERKNSYSTNAAADTEEAEDSLIWGGITRDVDEDDKSIAPPVCKHLMACVLAEYCGGIFGGFVPTREVTKEVLAEMAATWD